MKTIRQQKAPDIQKLIRTRMRMRVMMMMTMMKEMMMTRVMMVMGNVGRHWCCCWSKPLQPVDKSKLSGC